MSFDKKMLFEAAQAAIERCDLKIDKRKYLLGTVGLRNDGIFVKSKNIAATNFTPRHHAETRLIKKLTPGSIVWIARVTRENGHWAMSRPCSNCEKRLRSVGVKRIVYTISPGEWGIINVDENKEWRRINENSHFR